MPLLFFFIFFLVSEQGRSMNEDAFTFFHLYDAGSKVLHVKRSVKACETDNWSEVNDIYQNVALSVNHSSPCLCFMFTAENLNEVHHLPDQFLPVLQQQISPMSFRGIVLKTSQKGERKLVWSVALIEEGCICLSTKNFCLCAKHMHNPAVKVTTLDYLGIYSEEYFLDNRKPDFGFFWLIYERCGAFNPQRGKPLRLLDFFKSCCFPKRHKANEDPLSQKINYF